MSARRDVADGDKPETIAASTTSSSDTPVKVGVVGLGYWGPNIVRNLREHPKADVVTICDKDESALDRISTRNPGINTTNNLQNLLDDDEIEAIAIATPVSTHHAIGSAALAAGKHVFIEKPLADSTANAIDLAKQASDSNLVLMPGHTFLYSPPVNYIRDLLVGDELGDIYFISMSRVNLGLHQSDVSVTWDLGPHDFSILRYWIDSPPRYVSATSRGCVFPSIADVAFITLEFENGTIAHVELAWLAPSKLRRTTIVGSRKMVVYDDASKEPVRVYDSTVKVKDPDSFGEYKLTYQSGDIISPRLNTDEPLFVEMGDFCNSIRAGKNGKSSPSLGVEVVRIIEAVDESLKRGGEKIDLQAEADLFTDNDTSDPTKRNWLSLPALSMNELFPSETPMN